MAHQIYDLSVNKIDGTPVSIGEYEGKVILVVNVASKCGLTPQYDALEKLYENYRARGLEVFGFPANEFMAQEPGSNEEIAEFCRANFGVKFPMFQKIVVKGEGQHPLYKYLTSVIPKGQNKPGNDFDAKMAKYGSDTSQSRDIRWNFEKFLIDRKGNVVARFMPDVEPTDELIVSTIEKYLH